MKANALPTGFVDEAVGRMPATHGRFAPNPRQNGTPMLIVSSIEGTFFVVEDPDHAGPRLQIGDFSSIVCDNGPRGVLGFVVHPDFVTNPYIYVYYTRITPDCPADAISGPSQRLSRFTIDTATLQININSEVVFLETPPQLVYIHVGGAMTIGNDGLIYLCIGDGGYLNSKQSQNLNFLYGKLVRLDLDGNVPPSNPYTVASGSKGVACRLNKGIPPAGSPSDSVCEEIFAYGLRNPFKLGVNMNVVDKVHFAIGDVGNANWEEANFGGTEYKGTNYGWGQYEGPCVRNSLTDCPSHGPNFTEPFYSYLHRDGGGAITGSVFVPDGLWPSQYKYMIIEYIEGLLLNIVNDPSAGCRSCQPPIPQYRNETFHEYERMVDVFFGPYNDTQAMYYLSRAGGDNVRRIRYIGGTNRPPKAIISPLNPVYQINETISLFGNSSLDVDGDPLTFAWKLGDGRTSNDADPLISYTISGRYTIELTVSDISGLTSSAAVTIAVGMPPNAVIEFPPDGYQFTVGEMIRLKGSGVDSFNQSLTPTQLFWEVNIQHSTHFHPFMQLQSGNNFTFSPAPEPEDFMAATNSLLQFILTTVDSIGLSTTSVRYIYPKKVFVDIDSNVPGLQILAGDFVVTTPATITTWQNQNLKLEAEDQGPYTFQSWNIGGERVTYYNVPSPETNPAANGTSNYKIHATFSTLTHQPTMAPTKVLTNVPTRVPVPTKIPTISPIMLTIAPINVPSAAPTNQPVPSKIPTKQPTKVPTKVPTRSPSLVPTTIPTKQPTKIPTTAPTFSPTTHPIKPPTTLTPTKSPTKMPTKTPLAAPTANKCTFTRWDLYNSISDTFVSTLTNGTLVPNPPPCNKTNIEAVVSCGSGTISNVTVISELYNSQNKLVKRSSEKKPRFFLFANTGNNIKDGRIPAGSYTIRVTLYGVVGTRTYFTLGGNCV